MASPPHAAGGELSENDLLWSDELDTAVSEDDQEAGSSERPASEQPAAAAGGTTQQQQQHQQGVDIAGVSSASHQSSTLRASLDELDPGAPTPSPPVDVPGGGGGRTRRPHMLHQLPPPHQQLHKPSGHYSRLGTSAPIAIPNMSAWRAPGDKASGGRPGDVAGTFIPPHQLSRQDDFTFSFSGASPSAAIKRERLRARNAILRSTGFLEPQAGGAAGIAVAAAQQQAGADKGLARSSQQSSLTAALTTIGEAS